MPDSGKTRLYKFFEYFFHIFEEISTGFFCRISLKDFCWRGHNTPLAPTDMSRNIEPPPPAPPPPKPNVKKKQEQKKF